MKPTFEEFRDLVKKHLAKDLDHLSDEELEDYLSDEDSVDVIQHEYDHSSKQLEAGEITEKIFKNGSVSAASHTLYMLY